jgi:RNA polymerase sigma factor (sigma-70 family)
MFMQRDSELLTQYTRDGSGQAFAELVRRYVHLVYSAARRQVGNAHLAEDVTQAVFMILSQRASHVHNPAVLGGWLVKTARHVSCNALRLERRRIKREQETGAMSSLTRGRGSQSIGEGITPVLDAALSELRDKDRDAIVLRFLEGKSLGEVGSAMGTSEQAAQKRISRALVRLRGWLERHGITTPADALPEALRAQPLQMAPAGLVAMLVTGTSASSTASAAVLAKVTAKSIFWVHMKLVGAGCAAAVALMGGLAAATRNSPAPAIQFAAAAATAPATAPSPATPPAAEPGLPLKFPNIVMLSRAVATDYFSGVDPNTKRTENSVAAGYLRSLAPTAVGPANRGFTAPVDLLRGKRIRLSAWIKSKDLANWGGLQLIVYGEGLRVLSQGDMGERPIRGTTDWQQYSQVADVPMSATTVMFGANLRGTGELWVDDFQIDVVGKDVETTDDSVWHLWSPESPKYSAVLDSNIRHNGHPTMCVSSSTAGKTWAAYDHNDRLPEKYLGHKIRMKLWMKSEGVTGTSGPWIRVLGANFQQIGDEGQRPHRPIKGTTDWKQYIAIADVPPETQCLTSGLVMNGKGKIWIDVQGAEYEVVE